MTSIIGWLALFTLVLAVALVCIPVFAKVGSTKESTLMNAGGKLFLVFVVLGLSWVVGLFF